MTTNRRGFVQRFVATLVAVQLPGATEPLIKAEVPETPARGVALDGIAPRNQLLDKLSTPAWIAVDKAGNVIARIEPEGPAAFGRIQLGGEVVRTGTVVQMQHADDAESWARFDVPLSVTIGQYVRVALAMQ